MFRSSLFDSLGMFWIVFVHLFAFTSTRYAYVTNSIPIRSTYRVSILVTRTVRPAECLDEVHVEEHVDPGVHHRVQRQEPEEPGQGLDWKEEGWRGSVTKAWYILTLIAVSCPTLTDSYLMLYTYWQLSYAVHLLTALPCCHKQLPCRTLTSQFDQAKSKNLRVFPGRTCCIRYFMTASEGFSDPQLDNDEQCQTKYFAGFDNYL